MARTPLILDGLNLNDGTVYAYLPGVELGARQKTWSERKSYTGSVAQYNVSEAASIPMKFPLMVQGYSLADLDAKVQELNTKIDGCSSASPKDLVFGEKIYQIVTTARVSYVLDEAGVVVFRALIDLVPNRVSGDPSWVPLSLEGLVALGEAERIAPADDVGYRTFDASHGRAFMRSGKNYFTDPRCTGAVTGGIPAGLEGTTDMVTPPSVTRVDGPSAPYGEYAYHVEGTSEIGKTWNLWSTYQGDDFAAEDSVAMSVQIRCDPAGLPVGLNVYTNVFDAAWSSLATHTEVVAAAGRAVNLVSIPAATAPNIVQFGIGSLGTWTANDNIDFYFECLQGENSPYATPFFHGNEPGCSWAGAVDASISIRADSIYDFANADLIPTLGEGTVYMQAALEHGSAGGVFRDTFFRFGESDTNQIELDWWATDTLLLMANSGEPHLSASGVPAALTPFAAVASWDRSELRLAIDGVEVSTVHALDFDNASAEKRFFGGTNNPGSGAALDGHLRCVVVSETKKPLTWRQAISAGGGVTNLTTLWRKFMAEGDVLIPLDHDGFAYRKVNGPPVTAAPSFLFLGDSLTVGLFSTDMEHSYRYLLGQRFGATVDRIQGQSGGGSYDFLTQEAEITAAAPDVLILELGTNDDGHAGSTPWTLAQNLRTLIGWTRAGNPQCRVVVLGEWGKSSSTSGWDAQIERVANDYGGHFVSLDAMDDAPGSRSVAGQPSPWEGIPDGEGGWLTDAFHPSDLGHARIAAAVGDVIEGLL